MILSPNTLHHCIPQVVRQALTYFKPRGQNKTNTSNVQLFSISTKRNPAGVLMECKSSHQLCDCTFSKKGKLDVKVFQRGGRDGWRAKCLSVESRVAAGNRERRKAGMPA